MNQVRPGVWWLLGSISIIVSLGLLGHEARALYVQLRDNHHDVSAHKLVDCKNQTLSVHFQMPLARAMHILMGFDNHAKNISTNRFSGRVEICHFGQTKVSFPIDSDMSFECNWLAPYGVKEAMAFHWPASVASPVNELLPGKIYELKVAFSNAPSQGASLWAHFIQRHGDVRREEVIVVPMR